MLAGVSTRSSTNPANPTDPADPADPADSSDVALALYSLAALVVQALPRDISLTTAATLNLLERAGPQRMTQLAAREGVAQPSMTALVGKLEHEGLVRRRADPTDARAVLVTLTAAGRRYVRDRRQAGADLLATVIGDLPDDQATSLRGALPALEAVVALAQWRSDASARLTAPGAEARR